jgi:hypothetical protein
MKPESPTILVKALVAALTLAAFAAVPLLTVQYAVAAQTEPQATAATCTRACPVAQNAGCPQGACATTASCSQAACPKH